MSVEPSSFQALTAAPTITVEFDENMSSGPVSIWVSPHTMPLCLLLVFFFFLFFECHHTCNTKFPSHLNLLLICFAFSLIQLCSLARNSSIRFSFLGEMLCLCVCVCVCVCACVLGGEGDTLHGLTANFPFFHC